MTRKERAEQAELTSASRLRVSRNFDSVVVFMVFGNFKLI
jgi:hypothetical protein